MSILNPAITSITAFAPATSANVAVGFDILGFALEGVGDKVTLTARKDNQIVIESIDSPASLPLNPNKNTASWVIKKLSQDLQLERGFSIRIQKGIPLASGMGGSAASAVAALVALNAFLTTPLSTHELAQYALLGEELASGQPHGDNIVPCLFGGMTLIHSLSPIEVVQLPVPNLTCVLIHPHLHVSTKDARNVLKIELPLKDYVKQSAHLASFIAALYSNNIELMRTSLVDVLIEPQRAQFVPGFYNIKKAALEAGAIASSFSGSGPSLFAFAENKATADQVKDAMVAALASEHIKADAWVSPISQKGAHVI